MEKRKRRSFSKEYKADAVACELDLSETAISRGATLASFVQDF